MPENVEDIDQDLNEQQTETGQSDHNSLPNTETVANEHSNKGGYIRVTTILQILEILKGPSRFIISQKKIFGKLVSDFL